MDARWYSADIQRFLQPDYYNIAQLQTPMASRHLLLAKSGLTRQDLMMDPSQQMRYGYVGGNQLGKLDWNGLEEYFDTENVCYQCTYDDGSYWNIPVQKHSYFNFSSTETNGDSVDELIRNIEDAESIEELKQSGNPIIVNEQYFETAQTAMRRRASNLDLKSAIEGAREVSTVYYEKAPELAAAVVNAGITVARQGGNIALETAKELSPVPVAVPKDPIAAYDAATTAYDAYIYVKRVVETPYGNVDGHAYPETENCKLVVK